MISRVICISTILSKFNLLLAYFLIHHQKLETTAQNSEMEREFLKKAAAYFAKESRKVRLYETKKIFFSNYFNGSILHVSVSCFYDWLEA